MIPSDISPINSIHNSKIEFARALLKDKDARTEHGLYVVEGIRLAEEVLSTGMDPRLILFSKKLTARGRELLTSFKSRRCEMLEVYPDILERLSDTETSQGILLVLPQLSTPLPPKADLVLIIDQVRDPGNMGTILRTAAAVGVQLVFLTHGNVDPYMPKVVRSAMGAHFRLCIQQADWSNIRRYCLENQPAPIKVLLADSNEGFSMWQTDLTTPLALVVGGEAFGASSSARDYIDGSIHIPMPGQIESLNAGVAASVLLYEIIRQRNT